MNCSIKASIVLASIGIKQYRIPTIFCIFYLCFKCNFFNYNYRNTNIQVCFSKPKIFLSRHKSTDNYQIIIPKENELINLLLFQ